MIEMHEIPTYAINLTRRTERKQSLLDEFAGRKEFRLTVVPAIEHKVGSFGLWQSIYGIVHQANEMSLDYVLIGDSGTADHLIPKYLDQLFRENLATYKGSLKY